MITKYSDLKNKFKRLKSNQSYIISKGMENEDIKRKYLESIQLIIKGIKLAEELNDLELLIILKKKLASIYISIERYKEAIEVLEQIKQLKVNLNILDANKNYKVLYEQNKLIYEIGQKIMLNLNEDNIFNVISKEIMRVIRCDSIEILTYNEKREAFQYQGVIKEGKIIDLDNVNLYENKFVIYSIKHKKDLIINDIKKDGYKYIKNYDKYLGEINLKKNKANSLMVVPMIIKDKVKGALSLQCYEKNSYDLKDLTTLKMLSTYIAIALENYFLYKKLSDVFVTKVVYYKENKTFYIYLSSKEIISYDILSSLREALLEELDYFSDIKIKIRYNGLSRKSNKDIVKKNWDNVLHILKSISPAIEGWKKNVEYMCIDDTLKIKIPKTMLYDSLKSKHCEEIIRHAFLEDFSIDLNVILEKAVDEKVDRKKLMEKMEREMEEKVREMQISSPTPVEEEEEKYIIKEEHEDENIIYCEYVNALFEHISDIDKNAKTVCIVGEIFNIETKELKNGKILLIADVTDNTSSISCKLFLNDLNQDKVLSKISEGTNVRIKGDVIYDTFKRELTMTISGIRIEEKPERIDKSEVKRVELHAHTQMSSMDALCQTKKLVKQASQWGHKAIAITDHGVVQAFPEAMDAGKANCIKILYAVEGYLVEDKDPIIKEANDKD